MAAKFKRIQPDCPEKSEFLSLSPNVVLTDSDGAAESTVTPLAAGNITVTATATISGVPTSVTFNLVSTAPAP